RAAAELLAQSNHGGELGARDRVSSLRILRRAHGRTLAQAVSATVDPDVLEIIFDRGSALLVDLFRSDSRWNPEKPEICVEEGNRQRRCLTARRSQTLI